MRINLFGTTVFLVAAIILSLDGRAQDSLSVNKEKYLLNLAIPENWEIKRQIEGGDFTLSSYSPDNSKFIYYCQFMNDQKSRPKVYFKTYTHQFGMNDKATVVSKTIEGKKTKFFYSVGEGQLLDERYKIIFFTTSVQKKNVIAYLVYPLNTEKEVEQGLKRIMLLEE